MGVRDGRKQQSQHKCTRTVVHAIQASQFTVTLDRCVPTLHMHMWVVDVSVCSFNLRRYSYTYMCLSHVIHSIAYGILTNIRT